MRLRIILYALVGAVVFLSLGADQPPSDFSFQTVDKRTGTGKLAISTIRMKADFGTHEVETKHIRRMAFNSTGGEEGRDLIELTDRSQIRGKILTERITLETESGIESFTPSDLREIKSSHKEHVSTSTIILGLVTLAAMEIVLGIDNIIFLAIVAGKLPSEQQPRARKIGLIAALGTRVLLLGSLSFLLGLTRPLFTIPSLPFLHDLEAREISLRDLILLVGGLFLIAKSVHEMHDKLESARRAAENPSAPTKTASFAGVLVQIAILDIVFSLDSVITAIGMVDELWVMITAMVIAMFVMMAFAGSIGNFVGRHPTVKVLALAFLILIGVMLVAESLGQHMNKGYIYFAMAFAFVVEMINLRLRRSHKHAV